eukprot:270127_1
MDLNNPLVSRKSNAPRIRSNITTIYGRTRTLSDSDELEAYNQLSSPSGHLSYHHYKHSPSAFSDSQSSWLSVADMDDTCVGIHVNSTETDDDVLPHDIFDDTWQCKMATLLNFDEDFDDETLAHKLKNLSYSARALQLQLELPQSMAHEIISYELCGDSVEVFVRRSMTHNILNKLNVSAFISGWVLTLTGIYLILSGLNLFGLFELVPSTKSIYFIGNYTEIGWKIELSIILSLCTIHFLCTIVVYLSGRKWSRKIKRIKGALGFADAENCGEAYIAALHWLGFPFIETFNLNLFWFALLGFKYWLMMLVFIVLCLPFWVFEAKFVWLIISIPLCILCWIGAWLQLVTFQNGGMTAHSAAKELLKVAIMCLIVFGMLYGIIHLMTTRTDHASDGDFGILNIALAAMFVVILICVELSIIRSWKSVNVRYNYFGWQLIASCIIMMIFGVLGLDLWLLMSITFVLYNAAIIWNDLMHKKIMQTTYGLNKRQYVNKYRPIYNTDRDSEWLTSVFTICCSKRNCISKCRGRWVINCYAGLVTGRITTPTYFL